MGPRNTTEGHAAASTYNWSQERPGPAGGGWGVTITQLADREDSRPDKPCYAAILHVLQGNIYMQIERQIGSENRNEKRHANRQTDQKTNRQFAFWPMCNFMPWRQSRGCYSKIWR